MNTAELYDKTNLSNLHCTRRALLQSVVGLALTGLVSERFDRSSSQKGLQSTNLHDQETVQSSSGEGLSELIRSIYQDISEKNSRNYKEKHPQNLMSEILIMIGILLGVRGLTQLSNQRTFDQTNDESNYNPEDQLNDAQAVGGLTELTKNKVDS